MEKESPIIQLPLKMNPNFGQNIEYEVNIDTNGKEWKQNKVALLHGQYKYKANGFDVDDKPIRQHRDHVKIAIDKDKQRLHFDNEKQLNDKESKYIAEFVTKSQKEFMDMRLRMYENGELTSNNGTLPPNDGILRMQTLEQQHHQQQQHQQQQQQQQQHQQHHQQERRRLRQQQ